MTDERGRDVAGSLRFETPRGPRGVTRFSHEAMHTVFEVHAVHRDVQYIAQAARAAFDLVDRLEQDLSRFIPNSDVSRINDLRGGESTRVGGATLECLLIARHAYELTGGAFDPAIGTGLPRLALDADNCLVRACEPGARLDLGAIGKGYAVDLVADVLADWGVDVALVHGGFSSLLALEPGPGADGWPLTLSDPLDPSQVLGRLSVRQTALGASGLQKGDHIVDPRTGFPPRGRVAAWTALRRPPSDAVEENPEPAPRVTALADALTTAFMLMSLDEIEAACEGTPGLEAWILPGRPTGGGDRPELLHFGPRQP